MKEETIVYGEKGGNVRVFVVFKCTCMALVFCNFCLRLEGRNKYRKGCRVVLTLDVMLMV